MPVRTCVGCGRKAPKDELTRFVARSAEVRHDASGHAPGRGAYTCPDPRCLERATARRSFARVLREPVRVPRELQRIWEEG